MSGCSSQSVARLLAVALVGVLAACSGGSGGGGGKASPKTSPSTTAPPATIDLSKPIPGGSLHGTPRPPLENTGTRLRGDLQVADRQLPMANARTQTQP